MARLAWAALKKPRLGKRQGGANKNFVIPLDPKYWPGETPGQVNVAPTTAPSLAMSKLRTASEAGDPCGPAAGARSVTTYPAFIRRESMIPTAYTRTPTGSIELNMEGNSEARA